MLPLDGTWNFRHAPDDRGQAGRWFAPGFLDRGEIRVPGCWDVQGVGTGTGRMQTHAIGVGWYRRTFRLPDAWAGKRARLCITGVHRSAEVWVNGRHAASHWGYPVGFEVDVTGLLVPGAAQELVVAVDSRRHPDRDTLTGAFDVIDFMDVDWGGIFGHVRLEAVGDTTLDSLFVRPDALKRAVSFDASTTGAQPTDTLSVTVRRWTAGAPVGRAYVAQAAVGSGRPTLRLPLPGAPRWTTDSPDLLVADAVLLRAGQVLDRRTVRFGLRTLAIRGNRFLLNGEAIFLRGYGDDWTFPNSITGPTTVEGWRTYLALRHSFGFNAVRHHSTMPPEEYLDAADEVGILVQPELPIAYEPFFKAANAAGKQLYREVWEAYILQTRNHPSLFAWCMGNEQYNGFELGPELTATARRLDPTRPVIDTDGVPAGMDRPSLDYHSIQFEEWAVPWGDKVSKYRMGARQAKPVVVHEMGNLSVLPDPSELPLYQGGVRPFWLEAMRDQIAAQGLRAQLPAMLDASRRTQAAQLKLNIEAARLSPEIQGHHQWLFRDYWNQSTGFVSQFDRPRALSPELARRFVAPAVLLWDRDRAAYRAGERLSVRIFVSDFCASGAPRLGPITAALFGRTITLKAPVGAGGRGVLGPWTGTFQVPAGTAPARGNLVARCGRLVNSWPVWSFPLPRPAPGTVLVRRRLSAGLLDKLEAGATVLITDDPLLFPALSGRYKTAWWHGDDETDHNYGTMLARHAALAGFPSEGFGDLHVANLLEGRPVVLVDEVPGRPEPIIWGIDVPWRMRRKALLFEARVGSGRLLFSTLNLSPAMRLRDPAAAWLHSRLADYAASPAFRPSATVPAQWLRSRISTEGLPDPATWLEGFGAVTRSTEPAKPWHTYREDMAPTYPVRQTDGKQRLAWTTAPVPARWPHPTITFAFAGGIGWESEPAAGGFRLQVNDGPTLEFPFTLRSAAWRSADGQVALRYSVRRTIPPDSFGLFFLTVPTSLCPPGKPVTLAVSAAGTGSQRWFAIAPYRDVVRQERDE